MAPKVTRSERPEGTKRTRSKRAPAAPRGNGTTTLAAAPCRRERRALRPPTMRLDSARRGAFLRRSRYLQEPRKGDFALELDAELLARPAPRLGHEGETVHGRRAARVLDEVRVLRRDHRAADSVPLEATELEHPPRADVACRVLEDASEG